MSHTDSLTNGQTRQRIRGDTVDLENQATEHPLHPPKPPHHIRGMPDRAGLTRFKDRFLRKGKRQIGVAESLYNIATSSFLNMFIVFIPAAWALHFREKEQHSLVFAFSFLAIIPLERLFEYCAEQMAYYCGKDLGDLIVITLNNAVEATLAIILLTKDDYRVLQATIIGVILLHLLLIPGTAFLTGGARVLSQDLSPHITELNHTLLTMGVLSLVLPAAFFAAIDRGVSPNVTGTEGAVNIFTDDIRDRFLQLSRGISIVLLLMYICSRIYLHDPPGEDNALRPSPNAPAAIKEHEEMLANEDPEVNQWVCIAVIFLAVGLMCATAEWLVASIEIVNEKLGGRDEWFGLILLPIISFAADGVVTIIYFFRSLYHHFFRTPTPPISLAKARAIDLSIQFSLFWMPVFILLAWWTHKPLSLLFDLFEVAALVGACFLVNYVTADAKTNWAEGFAMISFYFIIGLCAWYYPGQPEIAVMLRKGPLAEAAAGGGVEAIIQH